jgi:hypothetical protein
MRAETRNIILWGAWLLLVAILLLATPSSSWADPASAPRQTVLASVEVSRAEGVPIPPDGAWATLALALDGAPPGATVDSVVLEVSLFHPAPGELQASLGGGGIEVPLKPEWRAREPGGTVRWILSGGEAVAGLPVSGTWTLRIRGPWIAPPATAAGGPSAKGGAYVERVTLRISYAVEMPVTYQVTEGLPGRPAAKRCQACAQVLDPAREQEPPALFPSEPGPRSGWQILESQGFDTLGPAWGKCQLLHQATDEGAPGTWGGEEGIGAGDLNAWLLCGPFDLREASNAYASFWQRSPVEGAYDELFAGIGYAPDGWFYGYAWDDSGPSWTQYRLYFPPFTGAPDHDAVWFAWNLENSGRNPAGVEGPWVDDVEIARALPCPVADPGRKGLQVHPNELPGQVETIAAADTNWVRLEFIMEPDGSLDLAKYTGMVDSLCERGVGVLGLVDYATIPEDLDGNGRKDYDDPEAYIGYQQQFTQTVEILANHFRGSITHWEIWNEENGQQWHVPADYYARLLVKVSEVVKQVDAANQILFGGLDHVWVTSQYLEPVYNALDRDWEGARPFDILAVHPYFVIRSGVFILDPNVYLWDVSNPAHTTLDKYLAYMASRGDGEKDIWITEIGWNSALDNPAIEDCPDIKPWCVTRAVQAQYLHDGFDILFEEVEDPQGSHDRVQTIVWYQYQDTGSSLADMAAKLSLPLDGLADDPQTVCPADWGLVDGARQPKPSYWGFQAYRRLWRLYVPLVVKADEGS